jgi:hypothetical protein
LRVVRFTDTLSAMATAAPRRVSEDIISPDQAAADVKAAVLACATSVVVPGLYHNVPEAIKQAGRGLLDYNPHESSIRNQVAKLKPEQATLRDSAGLVQAVFDQTTLREGGAAHEVAKATANEQPWIAYSGLAVTEFNELSEPDRKAVRATTVARHFRVTLTHCCHDAVVLQMGIRDS